MKEKKFRAWDKELKEWLDPSGFMLTGNGELYVDDSREWVKPSERDRIELMQFTGILDKNGKEIFEGDILKEYWEPCGDDAVVCGEYIGEVFYEDAGYWTRSKNHHHAITETCDSYEVIGNIYENPDLLKKE